MGDPGLGQGAGYLSKGIDAFVDLDHMVAGDDRPGLVLKQGIGARSDLVADFQRVALTLRHDQHGTRPGARQKCVDADREAVDE